MFSKSPKSCQNFDPWGHKGGLALDVRRGRTLKKERSTLNRRTNDILAFERNGLWGHSVTPKKHGPSNRKGGKGGVEEIHRTKRKKLRRAEKRSKGGPD